MPPSHTRFYPFLLLERRFLRRLLAGLSRQLQRHLLHARLIVIRANDALHQVVADHVLFVKEVERNTFHVLQNLSRFQQSAAANVRKIDLGNVSSDYRLGAETQARQNESLSVRPRMKAIGAISMMFFSR